MNPSTSGPQHNRPVPMLLHQLPKQRDNGIVVAVIEPRAPGGYGCYRMWRGGLANAFVKTEKLA